MIPNLFGGVREVRRRHRGENVKEYLSWGWPGRGGCLPVSFGMFGMLWGQLHSRARVGTRQKRCLKKKSEIGVFGMLIELWIAIGLKSFPK